MQITRRSSLQALLGSFSATLMAVVTTQGQVEPQVGTSDPLTPKRKRRRRGRGRRLRRRASKGTVGMPKGKSGTPKGTVGMPKGKSGTPTGGALRKR